MSEKRRLFLTSGLLALGMIANATLATESRTDAALPPAPACHYTAEFVQQRTLPSLPVPLQSRGNLLFACDLGLVWHTAAPIQETLVYTAGSTHFRVDGADRIHLLQGVAHDFMADLLLGLMAGDQSAVTEHFDVRTEVPMAVWLLTPRDAMMREFVTGIGLALMDNAMTITVDGAKGDRVDIAMSEAAPIEDFDPGQCADIIPAPEAACRALQSPEQVSEDIRETDRQ